ncbi:hypothetical protein PoB_001942800 [Plakobranchus ocellatus]|uniref:Uncharacterized protein n=1 Tax=Plakobranchus ocellatus TaxID=259542 RepID=A0AAV3ZEB1_9GAST|nr:hypothetical protein PoB_001942800 [Plakobranchus ocellatus]
MSRSTLFTINSGSSIGRPNLMRSNMTLSRPQHKSIQNILSPTLDDAKESALFVGAVKDFVESRTSEAMEKLHLVAKVTLENLDPVLAKLSAETKHPRAYLTRLLDKIEEVGVKVPPDDWRKIRAFLLKDIETDTSRNKCPDENGNYDSAHRPSVQDDRVDASAADASTSKHNDFNETDTNVEMERMTETERVNEEEDPDSDSSTSVQSDKESSSSSSSSNSHVSLTSQLRQQLEGAKHLNTMSQIILQIESFILAHPGIMSLLNLTDQNDPWRNLEPWDKGHDHEAREDECQSESEMKKFDDVQEEAIDEKMEDISGAGVDTISKMGKNRCFLDYVRSAYSKWRTRNEYNDSSLPRDSEFPRAPNITSRFGPIDREPGLILGRTKVKENATDLSAKFKDKWIKKTRKVVDSENKIMLGAKIFGPKEVSSEQFSSASSDKRLGDVTDNFEGSEISLTESSKRLEIRSDSNVAWPSESETDDDLTQDRLDLGSKKPSQSTGSQVDHVEPLKRPDVASENYVAEPTGSKPDHAEALKDQDIDRDDLEKKISHTKSLRFEDAGPSRTKIGHSEHKMRLAKSSEKQSVKPGYSMSSIRVQQKKPADRDAVQKYLAKHEINELFQRSLQALYNNLTTILIYPPPTDSKKIDTTIG